MTALAQLEPAPIGAPAPEEINPPANPINGLAANFEDEEITVEWPDYTEFLESKMRVAEASGFDVDPRELHPWLKPHCRDLVTWALRGGNRAIFAAFGLHKTSMQLEWTRQIARHSDGGPTLIVMPYGVRHGFMSDAAALGIDLRFIQHESEMVAGCEHYCTNYEPVRDGKLNLRSFAASSLDEASVLRSYGSKTFQEFLPLFEHIPFKLVCTATPSPNRYKELIHYAGFLGIMDTGQALTRWFQRNSEQAGDLTLYPHKEEEFWLWVHSWAAFVQKPSDLGYSDEGYDLPPIRVHWHEVPADHSKADVERDGQTVLFRSAALGVSQAAAAKRESIPARVAKMCAIMAEDPGRHHLLWHDLEAEREAIEAAVPNVVAISGSEHPDEREKSLVAFERGEVKNFATKPILSGSGSNFQYHCHTAIFVGVGFKFNDFIQATYRLQRFGQQHPVDVHIIYSEAEREVRAILLEKWQRDTELRERMSAIIKRFGLDKLPTAEVLRRSIGLKRVEVRGERFVIANNDAVDEASRWAENSVDAIVSSIPFGTQYEYAESFNDFGHNGDAPADTSGFWAQMDFLTPKLFRMLKPGRRMSIHVKDRILFGAVTGKGAPTVLPFHAEAIMHYRAHGFDYMGMVTVITDVVRENAQTYRLGWSENAKDSTKMGCGMPEYILLLRKPQSDRSRGYADEPVTKDKEIYTRARWQVDAHGYWRSSGNRLLTAEELAAYGPQQLAKVFTEDSLKRIYDYELHVKVGETLERMDRLPTKFMCIAPGSWHPDVWHDVLRMRTLNSNQAARKVEKHLCPLQWDIVDRLIDCYSNPGDLIYDPFAGLGTVPYRAILKGRRGAGSELNGGTFLDAVHYCRAAEEKLAVPALFDLEQCGPVVEDAAAPPPPR